MRKAAIAFTDGAARGNPGRAGWGAVIVTLADEVVELGGAEPHSTNNRMELTAAIEALAFVRTHHAQATGGIEIRTDSSYLVHGMTRWMAAWRRRGWRTATGSEVLNRDLWERLDALSAACEHDGGVRWRLVPAHSGVPGNERADRIATAMADGEPFELYRGPLAGHDLPDLLADGPVGAAGGSARPRRRGGAAAAHCYLSLVGGQLRRHRTWSECEARVRGRPGARFRKALS
jgi:ribonuclease HI